ncbi:hypothetical protein ALC57_09205 [Trachymyrmex cornetzi]|uniref:Uncharacterized protein n=1 Tax=Trachymyrmex cornetzi TaxID=471704 RepID=A0A195E054_9HYME|nr:hypothetical protein ALC57_09205 [Trachymyrmex cornetzi]
MGGFLPPLYSARRAPDVPPGAGEGEGDSVSAPVPPLTHAGNPFIPLVPFQRTLASARATGRLVATGFGSRATRYGLPIFAYSRILGSGRTIDIDRRTMGFAAPHDLDYPGKKYPSACTLQSFRRCSIGGENSFDRFYTSSLCDSLGFDLAIIAYLEGRPHDTLAWRNRHGRLKVVDFNERKVN